MPIREPISPIQQKRVWSSVAPIRQGIQSPAFYCSHHGNLTSLLMISLAVPMALYNEWIRLEGGFPGPGSSYIQSYFNFHSYLQKLQLFTIDYFLMPLRLKTERRGVCSLGEQFIPCVISPPLEMLNGQHQRKERELLGTSAQHLNLKLYFPRNDAKAVKQNVSTKAQRNHHSEWWKTTCLPAFCCTEATWWKRNHFSLSPYNLLTITSSGVAIRSGFPWRNYLTFFRFYDES